MGRGERLGVKVLGPELVPPGGEGGSEGLTGKLEAALVVKARGAVPERCPRAVPHAAVEEQLCFLAFPMPRPTTPRCPSAGHRVLQSRLREPRACCRIRLLLLGGAEVTWTSAGSPILLPDGSARSHQHSRTTDNSSGWGAGDGSDLPQAP